MLLTLRTAPVSAMAKRITQETFNNVVLENIKDFEMLPEEAVEDATKQFEAQVLSCFI